MFFFPPVYLNKKAIIVTPTISLIQYQMHKLNNIQLPSVFLGSAQLDKLAEVCALNRDSKDHAVDICHSRVDNQT